MKKQLLSVTMLILILQTQLDAAATSAGVSRSYYTPYPSLAEPITHIDRNVQLSMKSYEATVQDLSQDMLNYRLEKTLKFARSYNWLAKRLKIAALIQRGASQDETRNIALAKAVEYSDCYLLQFLLQQGIKPETTEARFKISRLCKTIPITELLLKYNAINTQEKDLFGMTVLHHAISNISQDEDIISLFITHGADVNATNIIGYTPLMRACSDTYYNKKYSQNNITLILTKIATLIAANADLYHKSATIRSKFGLIESENAFELAGYEKGCSIKRAIVDLLQKAHVEKEIEKKEQMCLVCFDTMTLKECPQLGCGHRNTCYNCMKEVIHHAMQTRSSDDMRCTTPKCINPSLDIATIASIMKNKDIVDQICDIKLQEWLNSRPDIVRCPTPDCPESFINEARCRYIINCPGCKTSFCSNCKFSHSARIGCREAGEVRRLTTDLSQAEHRSNTYIDEHTKPCPKCKVAIEKNQGCNHMTCTSCKHEYCWICTKKYKPAQLLNGRMGCGCLQFGDGRLFDHQDNDE